MERENNNEQTTQTKDTSPSSKTFSSTDIPPIVIDSCNEWGSIYRILKCDDPSKTFVIIISGLRGSANTWNDTIPLIAQRGYSVVVVELWRFTRIFNLQSVGQDVGFDLDLLKDIICDLVSLVCSLRAFQPVPHASCVIGHGRGSLIAIICTTLLAKHFRSLIAVNMPPESLLPPRDSVMEPLTVRPPYPPLASILNPTSRLRRPHQEINLLGDENHLVDLTVWRERAREILDEHLESADSRPILQPSMVVSGALYDWTRAANGAIQNLKDRCLAFRGSMVIAGAALLPQAERPTATAAVITEFLGLYQSRPGIV